MPQIIDDKSQHCIPFLLDRLKQHQLRHGNNPADTPPFFLGLNGVQGAGKTVLVSTLQSTLRAPPYSLAVVTLSLDDLYLPHDQQVNLARTFPDNPLLQHRGQPGTHDLPLAKEVFDSLRAEQPTPIPQYDKSAFAGQGDRVPRSNWQIVNADGQEKVKVVIFEGWSVGFRAWDDEVLRQKWEAATHQKEQAGYNGRLGYVKFEDVKAVNDALREYDAITDRLDALIHIDAQDLHYVYDWRQEQERTLRAAKGTGMTEEQVTNFVNGYYPSYELYTETLRQGTFKPIRHATTANAPASGWEGRQLRLTVNQSRRVEEVSQI
ncbi:P-loop containing nucleoside triphosphate hydrolase protein [Aspergillus ambiguus]|uniref:TDA10 family protein n=1 Tax=Aspergillus ambiguus TaxID=176160 RepID=UPI003CCD23C4